MRYSEEGRAAQVLHGYSLIGIFINILMLGVVVAQAHTYYDNFPRDPKWIKFYVFALIVGNTLNSAFNMAWIYTVLVNHFGDLTALAHVDWLFASEEAFAGIIATMVQLFFAWRLWVLTRKWWVVGLVVVSSSVSGLCAVGTAIGVSFRPYVAEFHQLDPVIIPWLASCTVCDVLIAASLSYYLLKRKSGFETTDTVVNKIVRSTVQNGLLTASVTIAHIISFFTTEVGIHMIFNYAVVKLYAISVLSSLNSRKDWAMSLYGDSSAHKGGVSDFVAANRSAHAQVTINVETHEMVDVERGPKRDVEWADGASSESRGSRKYAIAM